MVHENRDQKKYDRMANLIREYRDSGMSVTAFCKSRNYPRRSFYNNLNTLKNNAYEEYKDIFMPIEKKSKCKEKENNTLINQSAIVDKPKVKKITIRVNDASITIPDTTDERTIRKIVRAVRKA